VRVAARARRMVLTVNMVDDLVRSIIGGGGDWCIDEMSWNVDGSVR